MVLNRGALGLIKVPSGNGSQGLLRDESDVPIAIFYKKTVKPELSGLKHLLFSQIYFIYFNLEYRFMNSRKKKVIGWRGALVVGCFNEGAQKMVENHSTSRYKNI